MQYWEVREIATRGHVAVCEQRQDAHDHFVQSHKQVSTPGQGFDYGFRFMSVVNVRGNKKA